MDINKIKEKLATPKETVVVEEVSYKQNYENPLYAPIKKPARNVMAAYQNANRYLDAIKEQLLINLHVPFFSNIIHELAHTMPQRFDKFGDILHEHHLIIPYPATFEYLIAEDFTVEDCFGSIYDSLQEIEDNLLAFIKVTEGTRLHSMACAAETLLQDITKEYTWLRIIEAQFKSSNSLTSWDKWVHVYWENKEHLI